MTVPAVDRWIRQLTARVGMTPAEVSAYRAGLQEFCTRREVDPQTLLSAWQDFPELTVRRRHDTSTPPNLPVESFLIHNGVNVFGEIVCVAGRPEDLALQGPQFAAPERRARR